MHLCRFLDDALLTICILFLQIFSYINFNILIHAPAKERLFVRDNRM